MAFRQAGGTQPYGRQQVGGKWDDEYFEAGVLVNRLRVRVEDDGLRELVGQLHRACSLVITAPAEGIAADRMMEVNDLVEETYERLGELVRTL
jgi:hypothetical protein